MIDAELIECLHCEENSIIIIEDDVQCENCDDSYEVIFVCSNCEEMVEGKMKFHLWPNHAFCDAECQDRFLNG